jgi:hypothetical protein
MFERKKDKDIENIIKDNFDKYIIAGILKNQDRAIATVNGSLIDLSILFKSLFEGSKEVRDIAKASIHVIEMLEEAVKEYSKEKKEKGKKNAKTKN